MNDDRLGSYCSSRPRLRCRSSTRVKGYLSLRVGSWNLFGSLIGKSIELVNILKKRKSNITCV